MIVICIKQTECLHFRRDERICLGDFSALVLTITDCLLLFMSLNEISQILQYNCEKHLDEPLNLFCDDEKCPHKGLVCGLCEEEIHKHPASSLKLLLKDIHKDLTEFNSGKSLVLMAAQIDFEFNKCLATIEKLKDKESASILR